MPQVGDEERTNTRRATLEAAKLSELFAQMAGESEGRPGALRASDQVGGGKGWLFFLLPFFKVKNPLPLSAPFLAPPPPLS